MGLAALGVIAWYVLRRRKNRDHRKRSQEIEADNVGLQDKYSDGFASPKIEAPELGLGRRSMPAVYEMGAGRELVELDSPDTGKLKEDQRTRWVDERAGKGYDGAYRGN